MIGFTKDRTTIAVVGAQWGDEGKGKIADILARDAHIVARGTGGSNAGHTIIHEGTAHVLHQLPCGILYPNTLSVIGRGAAVNPLALTREINAATDAGMSCHGLRISNHARLVTPIEILIDRITEAEGSAIGTTGRGIGPTYTAHVERRGLFVNDTLNKEELKKKLQHSVEAVMPFLRAFHPGTTRRILGADDMEKGAFYKDPDSIFNIDAIIDVYREFARRFRERIVNTDRLIQSNVGKQKILLEGSQGILLSIEHGTYPFVTSSDSTLPGLAEGVGIQSRDVDHTYVVAKAPYMTRVGDGPFPTELGGKTSAQWCKNNTKEREIEEYPEPDINSDEMFERGVAIRRLGNEYGSTTKRLRRIGWLDIPLLHHALTCGGGFQSGRASIILTKLDMGDTMDDVRLCIAYHYAGKKGYAIGSSRLLPGKRMCVAPMDQYALANSTPLYRECRGWKCSLRGITSANDLPRALLEYIAAIQEYAGDDVKIDAISVGPRGHETIAL